MKCEFHVGDYVETSGGRIGYIKYTYPIALGYHIVVEYPKVIQHYILGNELEDEFIRIGQYDFTKPEQPKEIEKLPDGYGDGYVLYKGPTTVDGTVENGWVNVSVLSGKINELVDAVNELRKECNNG